MPLSTTQVPIEHDALVVGGGVAGMTAALALAEGDFSVHLVEREDELGGNLRRVFRTPSGEDPQAFLHDLILRVQSEPHIQVHLGHEVANTSGFTGRFTSILRDNSGNEVEVKHGATILATGGSEYHGQEYCYLESPKVVTGLEFEALLAKAEGQLPNMEGRAGEAWEELGGQLPNELAILLCVGPAEQFCGRICCTTALKNALALKRLKPEAKVTVLFKDIRTYGFKERIYTQAREAGVLFIRYDDHNQPKVSVKNEGQLDIQVRDLYLGTQLTLQPDLLLLSTPIVPSEGSGKLATQFKVPVDGDGFFLEAHIKLRPVDFASDGLFMAGLAHYPKFLDETIVQAQAAAARAARLLSQKSLTAGGVVAEVNPEMCVGCLTCYRVCPFDVPLIQLDTAGVGQINGAAFIEPTVCRGCGICVAECPAKAIRLSHYQDDQVMVKLDALLMKGLN